MTSRVVVERAALTIALTLIFAGFPCATAPPIT